MQFNANHIQLHHAGCRGCRWGVSLKRPENRDLCIFCVALALHLIYFCSISCECLMVCLHGRTVRRTVRSSDDGVVSGVRRCVRSKVRPDTTSDTTQDRPADRPPDGPAFQWAGKGWVKNIT